MAPFPPMADWLTPLDKALLAEAIRKTNAQPQPKHTHPDDCERCGGLGCDACRFCDECFKNRGKKRTGR